MNRDVSMATSMLTGGLAGDARRGRDNLGHAGLGAHQSVTTRLAGSHGLEP
jgi:hypothetical protein